jgi:phosphoglycerate-specific signal transduction histidine kinase
MAGWKVAKRKRMDRSFGVFKRAQEPEEERREYTKTHANMVHASNKHITPAVIACPPSLSNLAHKVGHPLSALSQNLAHSRRIDTGPAYTAYTRRLQSIDWRIICAKET